MKFTWLFMLALLTGFSAQAQITRQTLVLEGSLSYNRNSSPYNSSYQTGRQTTNFSNLNIMAGYAFSDRIIGGLGLDYRRQATETNYTLFISSQPTRTTEFWTQTNITTLAPLAYLKYQHPLGEKIATGLRFSTRMDRSRTRIESLIDNAPNSGAPDSKSKNNSLSFQLTPEFQYFISSRWGLGVRTGGLSYSRFKRPEISEEEKYSNFSFTLNPGQWQWGFFFMIQ